MRESIGYVPRLNIQDKKPEAQQTLEQSQPETRRSGGETKHQQPKQVYEAGMDAYSD